MGRTPVRRVLLVVSAVAVTLSSGVAFAQTAAVPRWRTVVIVSQPSTVIELDSVSVADRRHTWAVGVGIPPGGTTPPVPVIESWDGTAWTPVSLPAPAIAALGGSPVVTSTASTAAHPASLWAFALSGAWLHGSGGSWSAGKIPSSARRPLIVFASLAVGKSAVWAFGGTSNGSRFTPFAAIHGASGWKRTAVPGTGVIADASAVNSGDIWAVTDSSLLTVGPGPDGRFSPRSRFPGAGSLPARGSLSSVVRWHAGRWSKIAGLPAQLRNGTLGSVLARSDRNVWVGTAVKNRKGGTTEAVGHWNGRRWTVVELPAAATAAKYHIISMATDGAGGIWALGICISAKCPIRPSRLWHETGGRWSHPIEPKLASRPAALIALAAVAHSVWAAGALMASSSSVDGLIALWGPVPH